MNLPKCDRCGRFTSTGIEVESPRPDFWNGPCVPRDPAHHANHAQEGFQMYAEGYELVRCQECGVWLEDGK